MMLHRKPETSGHLSDEEIIELLWQRDESAISETKAKYGKMLYRIAYNILGDSSDSEECESDTYLSVWNRVPPTRPVAYGSFIAKISRDIAVNKYRARTSAKRIPSSLTVSLDELCEIALTDSSPESSLDEQETARLIGSFVRGLSERQHYIFIARYYFCESLGHIAGELGVSTATVQRETVKLRAGLKKHLERNGVYV